ncbi:MAG: RecX family transcriptional regulator [Treponema sp.]|jgi:regulatory protein|nr:RecX family transcriptional regulator [Treponema sp.]
MTIVSIKTGTEAELKRIELSDGSLFLLRTCYLTGSPVDGPDRGDAGGLSEGEEISAAGEEALRFAAACLRAERSALRLVTRAEQTERGLSLKLARRGFDSVCVSAVLGRLAELGVVDDRRFAGLWVQARLSRRAESPRRLLAGLRGRGIGREAAETALKSVLNFQNESALLRGYVEKLRPVPGGGSTDAGGRGTDAGGGQSLKYRLKSEGFSSSVIQDYWEEREW